MQTVCEILSTLLLVGGTFFALTGAIGIVRMPDFYSRVHPAGKSDTLAQALILSGLLLKVFYAEAFSYQSGAKLVLILFFLLLTTPTSTHAIAKAAHLSGLQPWRRTPRDSHGSLQGDANENLGRVVHVQPGTSSGTPS